MVELPEDPWQVDAADFPTDAPIAEQLAFLLNYACLAPTGHATHPYRFRIAGTAVEIWANGPSGLPVVDPHDRDLVTSCGAAVGHLEVALRHFGFVPDVEGSGDMSGRQPLARVAVAGDAVPAAADGRLFRAIPARRQSLHPVVAAEDAAHDPLGECRAVAQARGVTFTAVTDPGASMRVADLASAACRSQFANPAFPGELAAWMRAHRTGADSAGRRGYGMPDSLSARSAMMTRCESLGATDSGAAAPAADPPVLAVLSTETDTPADWLNTGRALSRIQLTLSTAGLTGAYLSEPVEADHIRPELRAAVPQAGFPQLVLHIARGAAIPPAGRQPVGDLLMRS